MVSADTHYVLEHCVSSSNGRDRGIYRVGIVNAGFSLNRRGARLTQFGFTMGNPLHYAIVFLIVAFVAASLGFGGAGAAAATGARFIFWVAIVLFVASIIANFLHRA